MSRSNKLWYLRIVINKLWFLRIVINNLWFLRMVIKGQLLLVVQRRPLSFGSELIAGQGAQLWFLRMVIINNLWSLRMVI